MSLLSTPHYSVVVSLYNEADNVDSLLLELQNTLQDHMPEAIIVVDDGSVDDTASRLAALKLTVPVLQTVRHKRNFGQSVGLYTGISAARTEWIVTIDGDGQNDPTDISKLLKVAIQEQVKTEPILIAGQRVDRQDSFIRKISSRIANGIRGKLLRDRSPDTGCALKLFRREDFLRLPHFNHFHRFLPALYRRAGGKVISVPVSHRPRLHGKSKYGVTNRLWVGIVDLFGVFWLMRRPCLPEVIKDNQ